MGLKPHFSFERDDIMDRLYVNGKIHSMNEHGDIYHSMGLGNGRIIFLSQENDAPEGCAEIIDLKGKSVFPGFIDSHLHMLNYAFVNCSYNMQSETSVAGIIHSCREIAKTLDEKGSENWVYGRGWNEGNFTDKKEYLTREDLDKISESRPILLIRVCGHIAAVNTKALEIVSKLENADAFEDEIDYEKGLLYEAAVKLCYNVMSEPTVDEIKGYIRYAQKEMNACGITSVETDNFLSLPGRNRQRIMQAYQEMSRDNELTVKVREQASFVSFEDVKAFIDDGYRTGDGDSFYSVGPIKLYLDGSLGAKTALLNEPYRNDGENRGLMRHSAEELQAMVDYSYEHDMQILVHAIGDGACDIVMNAYENAIKKFGRKPVRLAINHLQIVSDDLFDRMKTYDILGYIQPVFVPSDKNMITNLIGEERAKNSYLWKTMADKGLHLCGGSDSPVESFDILNNIQFAVTRDALNEKTDGWHPEEKLSVDASIRLFTIWNAYGAFKENEYGSLELGKAADFVILDHDIYEVDPHEIKDISVCETVVNGNVVYRK